MTNIHHQSQYYLPAKSENSSLAFKLLLFWTFIIIGRPQDIFPPLFNLHIADITVSGILITLLFLPQGQSNKKVLRYTEIRLVTIIFILMILLVPFALVKTNSLNFIKDEYLKTFIYFMILVKLTRTINNLENIAWTLLFSIFLLSTAIFLRRGDLSERLSIGTMYDPNDLAMVLVTFLPVSIFFSIYKKGFQRIFALIVSSMSIIGIILTQSRGGFLGLITVLILTFFYKSRFRIKYLFVLLLLALIFISFASGYYLERMKTITHSGETGSERMIIWERSLDIIYNNPIGYGVNNFPSIYGRYVAENPNTEIEDRNNWKQYAWRTAHNSFILITVELGLAGLAIYILLIFTTYYNLDKVKKVFHFDSSYSQYADIFRISLVGCIVCSVFLSQAYSPILLLIVAISSVMKNVIVKEKYSHEIANTNLS